MYYAADPAGLPLDGTGLVIYNRYGYARDRASGSLVFFDEARNWHFVRTLLLDPSAHVQWIFCSWGVKRRLLDYASANETDPDALFRATQVLHQPRDARPHDDHMHVRVSCSAEDRAAGCLDLGPLWPWLRRDHEKAAGAAAGPPLDDTALVAALMSDDAGESASTALAAAGTTPAASPSRASVAASSR